MMRESESEPGSGTAAASTRLDRARVEREVTPGLADIRASLPYSNEVLADTGIVLSADGLVLTSNNDIAGPTSVTATLVSSGRTYTARVLGYDATQDAALLQLEGAAHLHAVTLGNSSQVTAGMPVLALGNAQGQGGVTPAAGVIPSGQQSTTGFAIPVSTAMAIAREISSGQASSTVYLGQPGFLGVRVKAAASQDPSGALIVGVIGGTPASRAGLAAGDVITGLNGPPVTTPASLTTLLQPHHSGDVVSVSWTSVHGDAHTTHITLGNGPFQ